MSTFKVNFEISKSDADLLLSSLNILAQNTTNARRKKTVIRIIREIQFDYKAETIIFNELILLLRPMAKAPIKKNSHIKNQLGINGTWLSNSLHLICNHIVFKLLKNSGSSAIAPPISSARAMTSTTIKDVINLIKSTYEAVQ
ncbi:hypothetical protein [Tenacibaculum sp. 190524A05c]|uniref:hypothetical protein n=1 Tax=Tenacibaculum platacis TaxID=3137852 RepID=UPI0031FA520B